MSFIYNYINCPDIRWDCPAFGFLVPRRKYPTTCPTLGNILSFGLKKLYLLIIYIFTKLMLGYSDTRARLEILL